MPQTLPWRPRTTQRMLVVPHASRSPRLERGSLPKWPRYLSRNLQLRGAVHPMFDLDSLNRKDFTWQTALSLALASDLVYQRSQAVGNVPTLHRPLDSRRVLEDAKTAGVLAATH